MTATTTLSTAQGLHYGLLGMPLAVVVGRGLADGLVELRERASGERAEVGVADAVAEVVARVRG